MKKVNKQVKLSGLTNSQLDEISKKRKKEEILNSSKQAIVAELVMKLHKKECGDD